MSTFFLVSIHKSVESSCIELGSVLNDKHERDDNESDSTMSEEKESESDMTVSNPGKKPDSL